MRNEYYDIMNTAQTPHLTGSHIQVKHPASIGQSLTASSVQATPSEVIGYNDVSDGIKDELDVVGVRSTGHVGVHFFLG